tara:strand:- start:35 stop:523 length:489 start_codon:yes stop_codon:yes gene_type:complete
MALTQVRGSGISNMVNVDGQFTRAAQPAFLVHPTSNQLNIAVGSAVTVVFGTEIFDIGGNFASNTFTAPVTGKYQFNLSLYMGDIDTASDNYIFRILTSKRSYMSILDFAALASDPPLWNIPYSVLADMDASETASVQITQSSGTQQTDIFTGSYFSGYLVA